MSIGANDLGGALLWIGAALLGLALVTVLIVRESRRTGRRHMLAIDTAWSLSLIWLLFCGLGIVFTAISNFSNPTVSLDLDVFVEWPAALPCAEEDWPETTQLVCASMDSTNATVSGIGAGVRTLLFVSQVLGFILIATPAALIAVVSARARQGKPFDRIVIRALFVSAVAIVVTGIGGDVLGQVGRTLVAREVIDPEYLSPAFTFELQLWPLPAAVALAVLAAVFRRGAALQRETEGLV
ncbi:MAG: hypothetical protein ACQEW8_09880 [Actinomycetota bacterium]